MVVSSGGSNHHSRSAQVTYKPTKKPTPSTVPPANSPIGFNASKTAFVLPDHLGYLPSQELALAKVNSAYASGLANPSDWKKMGNRLYYAPPSSGRLTPYQNAKEEVIAQLHSIYAMGVISRQVTTVSEPIDSSTTHRLPFMDKQISIQEYVVPTILETQAAPVGISSSGQSTFCTPTPVAFLNNGKTYTPKGLSTITAGPSTAFTVDNQGVWDRGTSSCAGFH
jgi:hypothetical protein